MNWNLVIYNIFNGISLEFYISFYIFALIGMMFMVLVQNQNTKIRKNKHNIKHSIIRFVVNLIGVFLFVRFNGELNVSSELTMFIAFIVGVSIDGIVLLITKLKITP